MKLDEIRDAHTGISRLIISGGVKHWSDAALAAHNDRGYLLREVERLQVVLGRLVEVARTGVFDDKAHPFYVDAMRQASDVLGEKS